MPHVDHALATSTVIALGFALRWWRQAIHWRERAELAERPTRFIAQEERTLLELPSGTYKLKRSVSLDVVRVEGSSRDSEAG